jgi:hypothetical protein
MAACPAFSQGALHPIRLIGANLDTASAPRLSSASIESSGQSKRLALVQMNGVVQPAGFKELRETGLSIICYIPDNAYLVYGDAPSLDRALLLSKNSRFVGWIGDFLPEYKMAASAKAARAAAGTGADDLFAVQLVKDPAANGVTLGLISQIGLSPVKRSFSILGYLDLVVRMPPSLLGLLAERGDVISIQPYAIPRLDDERQDQILAGNLQSANGVTVPNGPGYLAWLASMGFTQAQFNASGFVVDVCDSGIDNGTTSPAHFGLYEGGNLNGNSRVAYNRLAGTPNIGSTLEGCDGHGTLNAHIAAGYNDMTGFPHADGAGYHYGLGVCPFVRIASSVVFDPAWTYPGFPDLLSTAYNSGARISTNSWGSVSPGAYTMDSQAYDALVRDSQPEGSAFPAAGNQEMTVLFSAGNNGPSLSTIGSPGTAKNVITVGAAENVQPFGGSDGCGIPDSIADNADDVAVFSSRGPCADGRMKPDLIAPGTHVTGGVFQTQSPPANGQADFCFTGSNVCGGPGADLYFPSGQQWTTASSGTSHACPAVAGGAALLRQFFLNAGHPAPSPAMTKACLANSARYLTGLGANDTLWSTAQGMGEVDLGAAFNSTPRVLLDQRPSDLFTATGQARTYSGIVSDPSKPFRVTLAWTDAPGSTVGAAYNNDLDLAVTMGGNTYLGNVFLGALSVTGGSADRKNNMESVFLPAGTTGPFTVTVSAYSINSDGVPNVGGPLDQDFALVISNAASAPLVSAADATLAVEECQPPNGAVDPGEKVTVTFALANIGTADATDLTATLQSGGGVVPVVPFQSYGALTAGGAAISRAFTFVANGLCGSSITPTLSLKDGGNDLGTVSFSMPLGVDGHCCGGTGPAPVPDGLFAPGTPVKASKLSGDGSTAMVTWDVSSCPSSYNVYVGPLSLVSSGGYDSFVNCAIPPSGSAEINLEPGNVFFIVVPVNGAVEGSHGRDGSAQRRPWSGAGHCGVISTDVTGACQ